MKNEIDVNLLVEALSKIVSEQTNMASIIDEKLSESIDYLNYYGEVSGKTADFKNSIINMTDGEKMAYYSGKVTCLAEILEMVHIQNNKILHNKTIKSIVKEES